MLNQIDEVKKVLLKKRFVALRFDPQIPGFRFQNSDSRIQIPELKKGRNVLEPSDGRHDRTDRGHRSKSFKRRRFFQNAACFLRAVSPWIPSSENNPPAAKLPCSLANCRDSSALPKPVSKPFPSSDGKY
jgi:hypothetical protein